MLEGANPGLSESLAAAVDWWREAGVDCVFDDAPRSWLAPTPAETPKRAAPADRAIAPPPVPEHPPLPGDLAAFIDWWLSEPRLDGGRTSGRVAPRGSAGAALMIVVPEPERDDEEELLAGTQGRLLQAMLAAMGVPSAQVYLAAALPRHTPMADWSAAAGQGLGTALRHHVALVRPRRLIAFGSNILPLLGNDPPKSAQSSRAFNHEDLSIPLLAASDLKDQFARASARARFWREWLDWSEPDLDGILST